MDVVGITSKCILYIFLLAAVYQDFKSNKISNRLILMGIGVAFLFRILGSEEKGVIWFLPDIVFPVIVLYLLFIFGVLGAGDIKLFSVVSGFTNLKQTFYCIAISFVLAAIWSFFRLLLSGKLASGLVSALTYCGRVLQGDLTRYITDIKKINFSITILGAMICLSIADQVFKFVL